MHVELQYTCVCIYIEIHTHIYIYVCIYIYLSLSLPISFSFLFLSEHDMRALTVKRAVAHSFLQQLSDSIPIFRAPTSLGRILGARYCF